MSEYTLRYSHTLHLIIINNQPTYIHLTYAYYTIYKRITLYITQMNDQRSVQLIYLVLDPRQMNTWPQV